MIAQYTPRQRTYISVLDSLASSYFIYYLTLRWTWNISSVWGFCISIQISSYNIALRFRPAFLLMYRVIEQALDNANVRDKPIKLIFCGAFYRLLATHSCMLYGLLYAHMFTRQVPQFCLSVHSLDLVAAPLRKAPHIKYEVHSNNILRIYCTIHIY